MFDNRILRVNERGNIIITEWLSGLVARSPRRRPGFDTRSVDLSEINFSDLYCGWLGRNINVEYNTIQYNTIQLGRGGVWVCSVPCSWRVAGSNPPQSCCVG